MPSSAYVLSFHAAYGCRDRGACCTAGWPIPIERPTLDVVETALNSGRLVSPAPSSRLFVRPDHAPAETPAVLGVSGGACVFYRPTGTARCTIHRALGHRALPLACRQFPRVSVHEPRGTAITLSHYCPTAADLLNEAGTIAIRENAGAFPAHGEYVGLDARHGLPPLLRPGLLMDWNAWWCWEREAVELIDMAGTAEEALHRLHVAVEYARRWNPGGTDLESWLKDAFEIARTFDGIPDSPADTDLVSAVLSVIPVELRTEALKPRDALSAPLSPDARRRFLAAHAFANWSAHLGQGLRTWLRSLYASDAHLRQGLSCREADLRIRHLADPQALADVFAAAEFES